MGLRTLIAGLVLVAASAGGAGAQQPADAARNEADTLGALVEVLKDDMLREGLISEIERMRVQAPAPASAPATPAAPPEPSAPAAPVAAAAAPGPAAAPPPPPAGAAADAQPPAGSPADAQALDAAGEDAAAGSVLADTGLVGALLDWLGEIGARFPSAALGAPVGEKFAQAGAQIERRLSRPEAADELAAWGVRAAAGWILASALALAVLLLARRRIRRRIDRAAPLGDVAGEVALRCVLALLPLLACFAVAAAWPSLVGFSNRTGVIFLVATAPFATAVTVSELFSSFLLFLVPTKGWRLVAYAQKRLAPLVGVLTGIAAAASLTAVPELRGTTGFAAADVASLILDLSVPLFALGIVLRHRRAVRSLIARGHVPDERASPWDHAMYWLGAHWHQLAILFVVLSIGARLFGAETGGFLTQSLLSFSLIVLALIVSGGLRRFAERRSARPRRPARAGVRSAMLERLGAMVARLARAAIGFGAVVACLSLWGFDAIGWMRSAAGASVMAPLVSIAVVSLTAWTLWVVLDAWIATVLAPSDNRRRSARVMTLLPLLRNFAFVALSVLTLIGILSNLGINVAPLVAGAGVIGLAIGFGSQQLVQDVITGLFILLEDTLAIGDVIDTGDRSGTVEALTIRTVKIRDIDGALHSIPFSTIKAVKNSSRGFGVYTASVTLDVDADVERALDVFAAVGNEIRGDDRFRGKIVAPLDVWGVDQVGLDGIVLKASIRTLPLQQYGVGRELNLRLKHRLQEAGVRLATRSFAPQPAAT